MRHIVQCTCFIRHISLNPNVFSPTVIKIFYEDRFSAGACDALSGASEQVVSCSVPILLDQCLYEFGASSVSRRYRALDFLFLPSIGCFFLGCETILKQFSCIGRSWYPVCCSWCKSCAPCARLSVSALARSHRRQELFFVLASALLSIVGRSSPSFFRLKKSLG